MGYFVRVLMRDPILFLRCDGCRHARRVHPAPADVAAYLQAEGWESLPDPIPGFEGTFDHYCPGCTARGNFLAEGGPKLHEVQGQWTLAVPERVQGELETLARQTMAPQFQGSVMGWRRGPDWEPGLRRVLGEPLMEELAEIRAALPPGTQIPIVRKGWTPTPGSRCPRNMAQGY